MPKNNASRKAAPNEKMIELRIRLWTNNISETAGEIIPKHAWDSGMIYMQRNASHGIEPKKPKPFHSLMGLTASIEKVLINHGVQLRQSRTTRKYFETEN
jgi:hypothetical protein